MKNAYVYPFSALFLISSVFADHQSQYTSDDYPASKVLVRTKIISDRTLESLIRNKLRTDPQLVNSVVKVKSTNGIVCISGAVEYDIQAEKIVVIAQSIRGVRDVDVSDLQIVQGKTPVKLLLKDDYITAKVQGALLRENLLTSGINIVTEKGIVYLTGCVTCPVRAQKIVEVARNVPDVVKVIHTIRIKE